MEIGSNYESFPQKHTKKRGKTRNLEYKYCWPTHGILCEVDSALMMKSKSLIIIKVWHVFREML